jgi:NAD(P)-dependent dehydrogenase (short-subunit alcohol dehydrogenase family)
MKSIQKILLTGASSGFGKLTLEKLLKRGHRVIAAVRGGEERAKLLFPEEWIKNPSLRVIDLDMENTETFSRAEKAIQEFFHGELDILINNAGYGMLGPLEIQSEEEVRHQMEVNFFGPIFLTQKTLPHLRKSHGKVINVSSVAGLIALPFYGSYNASKFALEAATEAMAYELRGAGIQFALVEPGGFKTDFSSRSLKTPARAYDPPYTEQMKNFENFIKSKGTTLGGEPEKVANLMAHLCEKKKIRLRYLIGNDANSFVLLKRLIPDSLRVRATGTFFAKFVF